ncbi:proton myo-inositol cotransporter-like [Notolabrus celidotus]|uniref:proton myo-inositol cotransporter-like n=1 Tax=Notolabrus celidotus TaxID=1203425 RepID=UPI00148F51FA|nr:proton myo-inositol cotransporter-like [Notolabrus celidotus]
MTVPVYIAEASPPHLRGQLVTVNMLFITGGQFTASLIDGAFSYMQRDGWSTNSGSFPTREETSHVPKASFGIGRPRPQSLSAAQSPLHQTPVTPPAGGEPTGGQIHLIHPGWARPGLMGKGLATRYMLGLSVLPAVLQFIGFLFLPESPRWLIKCGLTQKARRVLSQIRGNQNIDEEYDSIKNSIDEEESGGDGPVIWRMLTYPPTRRALVVGCGLQMFQQLSGINTVMYYSATILQMSGVRDDRLAIWLAGLTTLTNFLFTLLGVWLVDRVGRRKLILGSIIGTSLSLGLLAIGFLVSAQHSPPVSFHPLDPSLANTTCSSYQWCEPCMLDPRCGFCYRENGSALLTSSCVPVNKATTEQAAWGRCSNSSLMKDQTYWAYNYCPTSYSWLVLLGLVLYLAAFAPGMGPMPWTINSEIYPLWARSTGNACAAGVNWTFNILVSVTFLHMAQYFTYYGAFFLYSSLALLGFFFIFGCLPETKGRRLEEIEALFENQLCSCGASDSDEGRQVEYIRVKGSNYHLSDNDASDVD